MDVLNFYKDRLADWQLSDPEYAEYINEEVDILIHKLKFIPAEQRPSVLIVDQQTAFQPVFTPSLQAAVAIAGGTLLADKLENPQVLIVLQHNEQLYSEITELLDDSIMQRSDAVVKNKLFVIQKDHFDGDPRQQFLADTEALAEIIQPKFFHYGRKGQDWVAFDLA